MAEVTLQEEKKGQPCHHPEPATPVTDAKSEWQPPFCKTCGYQIAHLYGDIWIHITNAEAN